MIPLASDPPRPQLDPGHAPSARARRAAAAVAASALATLLSPLAAAAETATATTQVAADSRAEILHLMRITGSADIADQFGDAFVQQLSASMRHTDPHAPARAFEVLEEVVGEQMARAFAGPDNLLDRIVPIYRKHFSRGEIRELIAFYESPLGKKTIRAMPMLMQEGMREGQRWSLEMGPRIEAAFAERLAAEGLSEAPRAPAPR